jgi:hypothetical protein
LLIPGISSISGTMVSDDEAWAGGYTSQTAVSADWSSWGNAISYWESGPSNEWAATVLSVSWKTPGIALPAAFAFAMASLGMTWYAGHGGGLLSSVSATVFAGVSWLLALRASSVVDDIPGLAQVDGAIQVADFLTIIWDSYELEQSR